MTVKDLKALIKDAPDYLEIKVLANCEALNEATNVENAVVIPTAYFESDNLLGLYLFGE